MYIGVDIGGTKVLVLVMDSKGRVLARCKKKVQGHQPQAVLQRAWQCAQEVLKESGLKKKQIKSTGVAVPSAVDGGTAVFAPALGWRDVPVAKLAQKTFPGPVFLGNDVNLGLAAEYLLGAARKAKSVAGFFVGTGLGGALILDGKLVQGKDGMAGELGHMIVMPAGRRCGCGNHGCLEAYASKTAILSRLKQALFEEGRDSVLASEITPETTMIRSGQLLAAYQARDPLVREVVDNSMRFLGPALASIITILAPEKVVLGGGVIEAFGATLVRRIRKHTEPHIFGGPRRSKVIVASQMGDDAVPVGAALLARGKGRLP